MAKKPDKEKDDHKGTIALNKRARHEYHFDERVEAGVALQGWEVKSLRAGRVNITDGYAIIKNSEMFLFGAQIMPLSSASTHIHPEERRTRKLLLNRKEIDRMIGQVERKGYTLIPTAMYWKNNRVKVELGLGQGKKEHDKRDATKDREWQIEKARTLNARNRDA